MEEKQNYLFKTEDTGWGKIKCFTRGESCGKKGEERKQRMGRLGMQKILVLSVVSLSGLWRPPPCAHF